MAGKRRRSFWKAVASNRRLIYVATVLLTGSGAGLGTWQLSDHPVLQRIVFGVRDGVLDGKDPKDALADSLARLLEIGNTQRQSGVYEVKVADLQLDEAEFKDGQTVDLQARVVRFDDDDKPEVLWETRPFGERLAVVGKDPVSTNWANRPFEIDWQPGDRLVVEVWDRKGIWEKRTFQMEPPEDGEVFPLCSGPHRLETSKSRRKPGTPATSKIVLQSRRVGNLDDGPPARDSQASAERPTRFR